jgi:hypothetical protein
MSDVRYILLITSMFVIIGSVLPFITDEFGGNVDENRNFNITEMQTAVSGKDEDSVKTSDVMKSIGLMFVWTFGALPLFLELFFLIIRIILGILIYRQIRSGAG